MVSTFEFADNVVGIMIDSDIDQSLLQEIHDVVREKMGDHERINLFCELKSGNKVSFMAFLSDLNFNLSNTKRFSKIAIVTDLEWLKNASFIKGVVMEAEVKSFSNENRLMALNWITE